MSFLLFILFFVPHFAMTVFVCIYLHYRISKQRDTSFEFSSTLSTVDLSKHLITAFGNRVCLNLYEWAFLGNELFS